MAVQQAVGEGLGGKSVGRMSTITNMPPSGRSGRRPGLSAGALDYQVAAAAVGLAHRLQLRQRRFSAVQAASWMNSGEP